MSIFFLLAPAGTMHRDAMTGVPAAERPMLVAVRDFMDSQFNWGMCGRFYQADTVPLLTHATFAIIRWTSSRLAEGSFPF